MYVETRISNEPLVTQRSVYTTVQKLGVSNIWKEVSYSPKLHLFDQKYSINSNVVKYYCNVK